VARMGQRPARHALGRCAPAEGLAALRLTQDPLPVRGDGQGHDERAGVGGLRAEQEVHPIQARQGFLPPPTGPHHTPQAARLRQDSRSSSRRRSARGRDSNWPREAGSAASEVHPRTSSSRSAASWPSDSGSAAREEHSHTSSDCSDASCPTESGSEHQGLAEAQLQIAQRPQLADGRRQRHKGRTAEQIQSLQGD
jgi:hypothetical protein